ncbi:hypothetical protein L1765_00740 [Microaerobacter geothermalis]|uniref:hypothetical protein n=1 Tax=Microaerobacter geothermalis TaxID=674972 RepID=UPI001F32A67F|nr:hypothetical protein [Microaerobacter geothermalis]MCF6092518.1 hypothetical protein [Microaerobacter geothermalis]
MSIIILITLIFSQALYIPILLQRGNCLDSMQLTMQIMTILTLGSFLLGMTFYSFFESIIIATLLTLMTSLIWATGITIPFGILPFVEGVVSAIMGSTMGPMLHSMIGNNFSIEWIIFAIFLSLQLLFFIGLNKFFIAPRKFNFYRQKVTIQRILRRFYR